LPPTVTPLAVTPTPTLRPSSSSPNSGPQSPSLDAGMAPARTPMALAPQPIAAPVGTNDAMSAFPLSVAPVASAGRSRKSVAVGAFAGGAVVVIATLRRDALSDSGGPAKDNEEYRVPNRPDSTAAASNSTSTAATIPVSPPPKPAKGKGRHGTAKPTTAATSKIRNVASRFRLQGSGQACPSG
jgi:hypothetical protein